MKSLWLSIEVFDMCAIKRLKQILRCWHELTSFGIDNGEKIETLEMEWEVFDIVGKFDYTNDQLHKRVDEKYKVTGACISQCKDPQLHTIIKLPAVNILDCILVHVVSDRSEMQT